MPAKFYRVLIDMDGEASPTTLFTAEEIKRAVSARRLVCADSLQLHSKILEPERKLVRDKLRRSRSRKANENLDPLPHFQNPG